MFCLIGWFRVFAYLIGFWFWWDMGRQVLGKNSFNSLYGRINRQNLPRETRTYYREGYIRSKRAHCWTELHGRKSMQAARENAEGNKTPGEVTSMWTIKFLKRKVSSETQCAAPFPEWEPEAPAVNLCHPVRGRAHVLRTRPQGWPPWRNQFEITSSWCMPQTTEMWRGASS